jgi:ketosteroid isomerase-like protein
MMTRQSGDNALDGGVADLVTGFDAAFRADRHAEVAECFTADARLEWPEMEDIVGRDEIRVAFGDFMSTFHTISWDPTYQVVDIHGDRAYLLGRFVELREVRATGDVEHVPGRIVYFCLRDADGVWRFTHVLTSRYGEATIDRQVAID